MHLDGPTDLRLEGDLDLLASEELAKVLLPMCERPDARVGIDLTRVRFIDSTGIALLLRAHRRAEASGARVSVTGANGPVERVLHATGADEILGIGLP
jgi:anti-sigma B factor antagonist